MDQQNSLQVNQSNTTIGQNKPPILHLKNKIIVLPILTLLILIILIFFYSLTRQSIKKQNKITPKTTPNIQRFAPIKIQAKTAVEIFDNIRWQLIKAFQSYEK